MRKNNGVMPRMFSKRGLQERQRLLRQIWLWISNWIEHYAEHFSLHPIIARGPSPECRKVLDEQVCVLSIFRPQLVITQARTKRNLPQQRCKLHLCQLVVFRRTFLDNIARRYTEGGCTLLCPEQSQVPVHRSQALCVDCPQFLHTRANLLDKHSLYYNLYSEPSSDVFRVPNTSLFAV